MQIEEALARYVVQLQADGRSPHTIAAYGRHVRCLAVWLRERGRPVTVEGIGHEDVAAYLASPGARTRPDGTAKKTASTNALRTSIRTFFRYAHDAGYARSDPARLVRRAMCAAPPPRTLSEEEQARLLATLAAGKGREARRDHLLAHLMLATGIRLGSTVALDREDVDIDRGELHLRTTKGDRPGVLYLGQAIRDHLRAHTDGGCGPLFSARGGGRVCARQVQRRLELWMRRAGIRRGATAHALRHTFAANLYRRTGDLLLVQQALRHRSIVSTTAYARVDEARVRSAASG